ncbi:LysM peptidoglycan-binding domain-containing protein [candidate division WOR-3 bacterium]|nr:LysM peptidoglycan-binding domain-containing protein [candidate division WOR-3 bacterium]
MKSKILLVLLVSIFLIGFCSLTIAQEKITEEEALMQIDEYKACVEKYGAKVKELKGEVEPLKDAIAELDKRIADLQAEIAKYSEFDYYTVVEGDWLSKLAEYKVVYGHGNYAMWPRIYKANKHLIKNPDLIYPGWKLKIPRP